MNKIKVIAEIGSNWKIPNDPHNSQMEILRHITAAADCGADIVKVQIFTADTLYSKERLPQVWERVKELEFPTTFLSRCLSQANQVGVKLWASIFHPSLIQPNVAYLQGLKVASGDITYYPLLEEMAYWSNKARIPLAISTGAATTAEIVQALQVIEKHDPYELILFHCVSAYPSQETDMNLRSGTSLRRAVDAIGLSDHTLFSNAAELAVALEYTYFEKHFRTAGVDKSSPDYLVSASPERFRSYIKNIRDAEVILGSYEKRVFPSEVKERVMARRGSDFLRPNK